jgi:hypothetical protein
MASDAVSARELEELLATPVSMIADRALRVANLEIEKQQVRLKQLEVERSSRSLSST